MSKLLWAATVGDKGLEVGLSETDDGKLGLQITRHDRPAKSYTATEVRLLGEAIRLAGISAQKEATV